MKVNKEKESLLALDRLKEVLEYCPASGIFIWLKQVSKGTKIGSVAGSKCSTTGYIRIQIDGKRYQAHRLAWFYIFEEFPNSILDHIDTDKTNNKISNLRLTTETNNQHNKPSYKNTSGFKGISSRKDGRFIASFAHENKQYYIGIYNTVEEAKPFYIEKAKQIMGEFYNENTIFQ